MQLTSVQDANCTWNIGDRCRHPVLGIVKITDFTSRRHINTEGVERHLVWVSLTSEEDGKQYQDYISKLSAPLGATSTMKEADAKKQMEQNYDNYGCF